MPIHSVRPLILWYTWIDTQPNGSPINDSPSAAGNNIGPSYASAVKAKAGTSDEDQWVVSIFELSSKNQSPQKCIHSFSTTITSTTTATM